MESDFKVSLTSSGVTMIESSLNVAFFHFLRQSCLGII